LARFVSSALRKAEASMALSQPSKPQRGPQTLSEGISMANGLAWEVGWHGAGANHPDVVYEEPMLVSCAWIWCCQDPAACSVQAAHDQAISSNAWAQIISARSKGLEA
jgi:hypothetical protein